jgi:hypothetical protein
MEVTMGWICNSHGRYKKCVENFGGRNLLESILLEDQKGNETISLRTSMSK